MSQPNLLVVINSESDPLARLGEWLTEADVALTVVAGPELPGDLSGFDGLVVLGGPMGARDDDIAPWLPHERALLRSAVVDEVPTLGICLGAQLLAAANGGRVERNPQGPEIGAQLIAKRTAAAEDPLFGPLPITPDVIQWHYDAVTVLPPGALLLAGSPGCDHQAFRVGRLAWGVQFHLETTPDIVRGWATKDAANLADYDLDLTLSRAIAVHDDLAEVWRPFVHGFVAIVRDPSSVPPPRPVPGSSAGPVTDPAAIRAALAAEATAARTSLPMPARRPPGDE